MLRGCARRRFPRSRPGDPPQPPVPWETQPALSTDELIQLAAWANHRQNTRQRRHQQLQAIALVAQEMDLLPTQIKALLRGRQQRQKSQAIDFVAQMAGLSPTKLKTQIRDLEYGDRGKKALHRYKALLDAWKSDAEGWKPRCASC